MLLERDWPKSLGWLFLRQFKIIIGFVVRHLTRPPGEHCSCRKVAEGHLDTTLKRVPHGLPLRREDCVRPERGCLRAVCGVAEQSERRRHSIGQHPAEQGISISRAFDEHGIRPVVHQRRNKRAGRTWPMVADTEHFDRWPLPHAVMVDDMIVNSDC